MLGCRFGAKNTLDKNYLYFARKRGMQLADTEVTAVRALAGGGYRVEAKVGRSLLRKTRVFTARNVVFSGGVLGTVELLLRMQADPDGLPRLSKRLGDTVRTNSESLIGVVGQKRDHDLSKGIAIGSIIQTDEHSHVEPVRYPAGSNFFKTLMAPHVPGEQSLVRITRMIGLAARHPLRLLKTLLVPDMSKYSIILLYMRSAEGTLRLRLGLGDGLSTALSTGKAPERLDPRGHRHRRARGREDRRHADVPGPPRPCSTCRPPPTSSAAAAWATPRTPASSTTATACSATTACT
jgi:cholesterol oxidase